MKRYHFKTIIKMMFKVVPLDFFILDTICWFHFIINLYLAFLLPYSHYTKYLLCNFWLHKLGVYIAELYYNFTFLFPYESSSVKSLYHLSYSLCSSLIVYLFLFVSFSVSFYFFPLVMPIPVSSLFLNVYTD